MVDTPFFDNPGEGRLEADDIARAVMFASRQPPHVDVNEILVRPTAQDGWIPLDAGTTSGAGRCRRRS